MANDLEEIQQTIAEYERLAIETGDWDGTDAPRFSNDGVVWSEAWLPTAAHLHPALARARVFRKGVTRPIVAIVRWAEALPADDHWRERWLQNPVALFGSYAKRAALRTAFRDVIGDRREPDEQPAPATVDPDRDFMAELAEASTESDVQKLHREAKAARVVTVELERAIRQRLARVKGRTIPSPEPLAGSPIAKLREGGLVSAAIEIPTLPPATIPSPADIARVSRPLQPEARPKGERRPQQRNQHGSHD